MENKLITTLVILLTSLNVSAQFQDTACRKLGVDHAIYQLGHDYYTQYTTLESIGFTIWHMPDYTLEQLDSFTDEPYYKLLTQLGKGAPYSEVANVLTVPVDFHKLDNYIELIDKLRNLSPEMKAFESNGGEEKPDGGKIVKFKAEGQDFERRIKMEDDYIDESFLHFFQEIVINFTNSDKGQLCWFLSMDEQHLVFMWLTPQQMLYMNETLHLHRIVYD